jgi:hypothetical protein
LTTDRFGNPNSAYDFLGTDDYIDLPNLAALKPQLPFSVSLWVYFNDHSHYYAIFCTDNNEQQYTGAWIGLTLNSSGDTVMSINYGNGGMVGHADSRRTKAGTTKIHIHTWYYVAAIFRGPTDMDLYIFCRNDKAHILAQGGL